MRRTRSEVISPEHEGELKTWYCTVVRLLSWPLCYTIESMRGRTIEIAPCAQASGDTQRGVIYGRCFMKLSQINISTSFFAVEGVRHRLASTDWNHVRDACLSTTGLRVSAKILDMFIETQEVSQLVIRCTAVPENFQEEDRNARHSQLIVAWFPLLKFILPHWLKSSHQLIVLMSNSRIP